MVFGMVVLPDGVAFCHRAGMPSTTFEPAGAPANKPPSLPCWHAAKLREQAGERLKLTGMFLGQQHQSWGMFAERVGILW